MRSKTGVGLLASW